MSDSRREFLQKLGMGGLAMGAPRAVSKGFLQERWQGGVIVDAMSGFRPDPSQPDAGFSAIDEAGVTVVSPTMGSVVPEESYQSSIRSLSRLGETVARYRDRLTLVRRFSDVEHARQERKLGILPNLQNSTAIGTDLSRLDLFYDLGVRQIQLTFNWRNWVGDGCTERTQAGLSYFGVELVHRMNELGILVDVSHSGHRTTLDAIEVSEKPIVFSHTNCKALCDHPRNKTDDQIRALARSGGVMGISSFNWFVSDKPRSSLDDLLDHYDHAIRLVGPDHVGIGSDFGLPGWEGTEPDAEWERHRRIYGEREWETLRGRFPPYIEEVNHAGRYRVIAQGLERQGHSSADIEKILGLNFLRVYREVLKP